MIIGFHARNGDIGDHEDNGDVIVIGVPSPKSPKSPVSQIPNRPKTIYDLDGTAQTTISRRGTGECGGGRGKQQAYNNKVSVARRAR